MWPAINLYPDGAAEAAADVFGTRAHAVFPEELPHREGVALPDIKHILGVHDVRPARHFDHQVFAIYHAHSFQITEQGA